MPNSSETSHCDRSGRGQTNQCSWRPVLAKLPHLTICFLYDVIARLTHKSALVPYLPCSKLDSCKQVGLRDVRPNVTSLSSCCMQPALNAPLFLPAFGPHGPYGQRYQTYLQITEPSDNWLPQAWRNCANIINRFQRRSGAPRAAGQVHGKGSTSSL